MMRETGIYAWFGFDIPMPERFRLIKQAGFTHTFLWWGDEYTAFDEPKENHPELARTSGLVIDNVHMRFSAANELWTDSSSSEELMQEYEKCIGDCANFEIPTAVLHLTSGPNPPPPTAKGIDRIRQLTDLAEKKAVNIALENLRRADYLDYVFSKVASKRLGFCYDSGHDYVYTSKNCSMLTAYGDRLMALHLHDNDGLSDRHMVPGEGEIDWTLIKSYLDESAYKGPIALEVTNQFSDYRVRESAEEFLQRAYDSIARLFD